MSKSPRSSRRKSSMKVPSSTSTASRTCRSATRRSSTGFSTPGSRKNTEPATSWPRPGQRPANSTSETTRTRPRERSGAPSTWSIGKIGPITCTRPTARAAGPTRNASIMKSRRPTTTRWSRSSAPSATRAFSVPSLPRIQGPSHGQQPLGALRRRHPFERLRRHRPPHLLRSSRHLRGLGHGRCQVPELLGAQGR
jgi:hypothetical protein